MDMPNLNKLHLLVIDDDDFMLELVKTALAKVGITDIITANNGRLALTQLDTPEQPIDLILCDLNMPEMDGIELLRHLASRNFQGDIILFSGEDEKLLATAEKLAEKHKLHILGALPKPFNVDNFTTILQKHQESPSPTDEKRTYELSKQDLEKAIAENEIVLYYQPQVRIKDKKLIGFESLVRWVHPEYGVIPPDYFIPLAEEQGVIGPLTEKTVLTAIEQMQHWRETYPDVRISINISALLLNRLDMPEFIESHVKDAKLDPSHFLIEITESQLIKYLATAMEILTRLSMKRFRLSIDDFGTGYSSLQQLQEIPFTELKIDKAFVNKAADSPTAKAILESSVKLAQSLHMETVAEGVETQEDWDLVEASGCDIVQGYFVSKPMPADEVPAWIDRWTKETS